jgi:2-dehydro-3-deoxyphosphogluconate aldolase/(4S)-4-hydroxy-2-oxoglutarate aldolase
MKDLFGTTRIVPVVTIERAAQAVPLAEALAKGGLPVIEVTLRTAEALKAIDAIAKQLPEIVLGAGTLLQPDDVTRAADAGARFLVSPGLTESLAAAAKASLLPFLPGVATPSEIIAARDLGFTFLKFYPAAIVGGVPALKTFAQVFRDIRFCPTGGVDQSNAAQYLALPNVPMIGGSWVAPNDAVAAGDWPRITQLAAQAAGLARR